MPPLRVPRPEICLECEKPTPTNAGTAGTSHSKPAGPNCTGTSVNKPGLATSVQPTSPSGSTEFSCTDVGE